MARNPRDSQVIHEFLGSVQVFSSAVKNVVEKEILKAVVGDDLTLSQFNLLKMVALTDARTISDVALFLAVSKAAASKAADKLVRRSLLRRVEGKPDRREIRLELTESSRRLLARYDEQRERQLGIIFRSHPAAVLRRTAYLLDHLSAGLVNQSARREEVCLQCGVYFRDRCLVRQLTRRDCFYMNRRSRQKRAARAAETVETAAAGRKKS
jgi:DNA-binding MarR family transcriptional regulator